MASINLLFYSNLCPGSRALIAMMQKENLIRFFQLVNTDEANVPNYVKLTPTIILKGNPRAYVAGDAFSWLARVKQWKINMQMSQVDIAQREYLAKVDSNLKVDDKQYLGFSEIEMSSMSDMFSFFSDDITKDCDEALPQSYQKVETLGKTDIFAPPLEGSSYDVSDIKKPDARQTQEAYLKLKKEREKYEQTLRSALGEFRNRQ